MVPYLTVWFRRVGNGKWCVGGGGGADSKGGYKRERERVGSGSRLSLAFCVLCSSGGCQR